MWLADSAPSAVYVGMWVSVITVTVLLLTVVVRIAMSWSKLVGQMDYVLKMYEKHLEEEREDRNDRAGEVQRQFDAMNIRVERTERAIDDIRKRMRDGRPT